MLQHSKLTKRDVQILSGLWAHAIQFKRETATVLQKWWQSTAHWGANVKPLPACMARELCVLMLHLPLLQVDLRAKLPDRVIATDACTTGGGVCEGFEVTCEGKRHLVHETRGLHGLGRDKLCLFLLGDELGRTRRCLDRLGIETTLCICWPRTKWGAEVIKHAWPDTLLASSSEEVCELWRSKLWSCVHLRVVLIAGAPLVVRDFQLDGSQGFVIRRFSVESLSEEPLRQVRDPGLTEELIGYSRDHTLHLCSGKDRKGHDKLVHDW
eukprot:3391245-Amphidinium_carterae.1